MKSIAILYRGFHRTTEVEVEVIDMGCGAGKITCPECGGSGDWSMHYPETPVEPAPCVECKGAGFIYISI